jgi:phosphatidylserine/phosphatidylglycerophosphate/cardiolipin synthase-like enzyme
VPVSSLLVIDAGTRLPSVHAEREDVHRRGRLSSPTDIRLHGAVLRRLFAAGIQSAPRLCSGAEATLHRAEPEGVMRASQHDNGVTALAVAGTHVVLLGWDMPKADIRAQRVLGFAVSRRRHADGEVIWMPGMKTFRAVEPDPAPGAQVSSYRHPLQTFQWADYTASPEQTYTYRIVAMTGSPGALVEGPEVSMTVTTHRTDLGKHAVFFNRGAVASQEYARRFNNRPPNEIGQSAYDWLSRGLIESLEGFIAAAGAGHELHGAFFEFKNSRIYRALQEARARGASVKVLYDGDSQAEGNETALDGSGLEAVVQARTRSGGFAHNKFLVRRQGGVSQEVWTGSTNLSENGIFGHSNNAHLVRDPEIAEQYYRYWQILENDETAKPTAIATEAMCPAPPAPWTDETIAVFSPRRTLDVLDWYKELAAGADRALFTTFAFGMNDRFAEVYDRQDGVLRFALMEKKGNGRTFKKQAAEIDRIRRLPNVVVSVGHRVELNAFDRWLGEIDRIVDEAHVLYVHTKYMLIDPLGPTPVVIVGSANFSVASTTSNDENMLVIRGNPDVADIYLGEFMRLFSHYAFRESLQFKGATSPAAAPRRSLLPPPTGEAGGRHTRRKHLVEDTTWVDGERPGQGYFDAGTDRMLRRVYFSGQ